MNSEANWRETVAVPTSRFDALNVLINTARITLPAAPVEETSEAGWDRVMNINARAYFRGPKAAIPEMRKQGGGCIINISSQCGYGMVGGIESTLQNQASKGVVRAMTKPAGRSTPKWAYGSIPFTPARSLRP